MAIRNDPALKELNPRSRLKSPPMLRPGRKPPLGWRSRCQRCVSTRGPFVAAVGEWVLIPRMQSSANQLDNLRAEKNAHDDEQGQHHEHQTGQFADVTLLIVRSIVRRIHKKPNCLMISMGSGGRGGIRTHGTLAGTPVFKTGALNHSATLPLWRYQALRGREIKNGR